MNDYNKSIMQKNLLFIDRIDWISETKFSIQPERNFVGFAMEIEKKNL